MEKPECVVMVAEKWSILGSNKFEMTIIHSFFVQLPQSNYRIDQQANIFFILATYN